MQRDKWQGLHRGWTQLAHAESNVVLVWCICMLQPGFYIYLWQWLKMMMLYFHYVKTILLWQRNAGMMLILSRDDFQFYMGTSYNKGKNKQASGSWGAAEAVGEVHVSRSCNLLGDKVRKKSDVSILSWWWQNLRCSVISMIAFAADQHVCSISDNYPTHLYSIWWGVGKQQTTINKRIRWDTLVQSGNKT